MIRAKIHDDGMVELGPLIGWFAPQQAYEFYIALSAILPHLPQPFKPVEVIKDANGAITVRTVDT